VLWCARIAAAVALSHRCCRAPLAPLRLLRSPLGPLLLLYRAGQPGALVSLLPCDSHLASCMVRWHTASLLPWRSRIAAAVPLLRHGRRAKLASRLLCRSRTSLLLCHSRITTAASVALSRHCHRVALAFLSARAPAGTAALALTHRCCRAALASWPPCEACIAAAVPLSHITAAVPLSPCCCCGALASLLLWRSRVAAAVRLLHS
jgi:hypothetical protein